MFPCLLLLLVLSHSATHTTNTSYLVYNRLNTPGPISTIYLLLFVVYGSFNVVVCLADQTYKCHHHPRSWLTIPHSVFG